MNQPKAKSDIFPIPRSPTPRQPPPSKFRLRRQKLPASSTLNALQSHPVLSCSALYCPVRVPCLLQVEPGPCVEYAIDDDAPKLAE